MNTEQLVKGKKVLVFGLGLQGGGMGDALWLHQHGAVVRVTDLKSATALSSSLSNLPTEISTTLGEHLDSDIDWADLIIKNPGVPDTQPQLVLARQLDKPIYTSIALVVQEARGKVIGITGTRGKSTTTELVYALLDSIYPGKVAKGGNVAGTSGLALLDNLANTKYLVLELSSFQLAGFHSLEVSPHYSILTNIYPDHLNRYPGMTEYQYDKSAIYAYQDSFDHLVYNQDNDLVNSMAKASSSILHPYSASDTPQAWQLKLIGEHNRENIAAVITLSRVLGIELDQVQTVVSEFSPVAFRLELIRELDGIKYYNDTTSTTPTATIKAIEAMTSPTILILGGDDKQLPTSELLHTLSDANNLSKIILLGCRNIPDFVKALKESIPDKITAQVFSMAEAVALAHSLAQSGETVLLSPGFASFDLFENEFDRGRQFNDLVAQIT